jgi:exodeoxyribonuclease V alpha subunit
MFFRALELLGRYPHLIFVGDTVQLSPVGIGNPFIDIIALKIFERVPLTEVFRQAGGSLLDAVTQIRKGETITVSDDKFRVIKYADETRNEQIIDWSVAHPDQSAVLTTKKNLVDELTPIIRDHVNPETRSEDDECRRAFPWFRPQDKVMQVKNNNGRAVYNGTSGTVVGVIWEEQKKTKTAKLHVRFKSSDQYYTNKQASEELRLAYVITVHKSQGSEYDNVLMIMDGQYGGGFINRNLVYTGTSRGKKSVQVLVKNYDCIPSWKQKAPPRATMLKHMIFSKIEPKEDQ